MHADGPSAVAGSVLAIDFGTSFTVAAARVGDTITEIRIEGDARFPSVVLVDDAGGFQVGQRALNRAVESPERLLRPKRYLGQRTLRTAGRRIIVGEAVQAILERVRVAVEREMALPSDIVLTHPADWETSRKQQLKDAATAAGLTDVRLIAEPVAAVQYLADTGQAKGATIAVYDLGGGTFDIAVLEGTAHKRRIVAVGGSDRIGGERFTDMLLDDLILPHLHRTANDTLQDALARDEALLRSELRDRARLAKHELSDHPNADLPLRPYLDLPALRITQEEFNTLIKDEVHATIDDLETVLQDAGVQAADLDGLYLTGDSSRIPLIDGLLHERLNFTPKTATDPKLIIARGALQPTHAPPPKAKAAQPKPKPPPAKAKPRAPATPKAPARSKQSVPASAAVSASEPQGHSEPSGRESTSVLPDKAFEALLVGCTIVAGAVIFVLTGEVALAILGSLPISGAFAVLFMWLGWTP